MSIATITESFKTLLADISPTPQALSNFILESQLKGGIFVVLLSIVVGLAGFYVFQKTNSTSKGDLPLVPVYPGGKFLVGNLPQLIKHTRNFTFNQMVEDMNKEKAMMRFEIPLFGESSVAVKDANLAKRVLQSPKEFHRPTHFQDASEGIMRYALFVIPGEQQDIWKHHRKGLQPAFGPSHIKSGFEICQTVSQSLFTSWNEMDTSNINIHQHFNYLSVDIIGKIAFSYEFNLTTDLKNIHLNAEKQSTMENIDTVMGSISKRFNPKILWGSLGVSVSQLKPAVDAFHALIDKVINDKKEALGGKSPSEVKGGKLNMDVLDRLIETSWGTEKNIQPFTDEELKDEMIAFFLAGHETTSNSMTFIILELCKNPNVFAKLRQEVDQAIKESSSGADLDYDQIAKLTYMDCVVKETQRYHPVVPLAPKVAREDVEMDGFLVKKDTEILVNISGLHSSPKYWKEPQVFNPERWENGFVPVPGSFLPFGEGVTKCVGMKLALVEMKTVIAMMVHKYDFTLVPDQDLKPLHSITVGLKNGLSISIKPRQ